MITLESIAWKAGTFHLEGIHLAIESGRYAVLMGPTGCGKTTLLEIICGLRRPSAGRVLVGGRDVTAESPGARGIGYVPQDGALFPTQSVAEHLGFALRLRRRARAEIDARVRELAEALGLLHLLTRHPHDLSGGERQRVALGRALAPRPQVLLLDEPLSALDEDLRDDLLQLLSRTQRQYGFTALHVTHSRAEAERIADVGYRLEDGRILAGLRPADGRGTRGRVLG